MKLKVSARSTQKNHLKRKTKWSVDITTVEEYFENLIPPLMKDKNISKILKIYTLDLFMATTNKTTYGEIKVLTKSFKKMEDKELIIPILEVMRQYHDSKIIPFVLLHAVEKHAPELTYLATKAILKHSSDPILLLKFYRSRLNAYPSEPVNEAVIEFLKSLPPQDLNAVTTFKIRDKDLEIWINRNWKIPVNQEVKDVLISSFTNTGEKEITKLFYTGRHCDAFVKLHSLAMKTFRISEDIVSVVEQFTQRYRMVPRLNLNLYELFRFYWGFRKALGKAIYVKKQKPTKRVTIHSLKRLVSTFEKIVDQEVSRFYETHETMFGDVLIANTEKLKVPLYLGLSKRVYLDEVLAAITTIVSGGKYPVYSVNRKIKVWYPEGKAKKSVSARFKSIMEFLLENRADKVTAKSKIIPEAENVVKLGAHIDETWRVSRRVWDDADVIGHSYTVDMSPPPLAIEFGTYAGFSFRVVNYFTLPWEIVAIKN